MERKPRTQFGQKPGSGSLHVKPVNQNEELLKVLMSEEPTGDEVVDFLRASWKGDAARLSAVSQNMVLLKRKVEQTQREFDQGLGAVGRTEILIAERLGIELTPTPDTPTPDKGDGKGRPPLAPVPNDDGDKGTADE